MNTPSSGRARLTRSAVVAAVVGCVACCAGPLIAIVGSVGAASLLGAYWIPALLTITVLASATTVLLLVRRRRARACRIPRAPMRLRADADRPAERVSEAASSTP